MAAKPLYNLETEKALLGITIIHPDAVKSYRLDPNIFYKAEHRDIYSAILHLSDRDIVPDIATISDHLERVNKLKFTGGTAYLAELIGAAPVGMDYRSYVDNVSEYAHRRFTLEAATLMAKKAIDTSAPLDVTDELYNLSRSGYSQVASTPLSDHLSDFYDVFTDAVAHPKDIWGVPTGFARFDRMTGGLQASETFILSGKPGTGKTMYATQLAWQMAKAGYPGVFYSSEMKSLSLQRRMISALSGVHSRAIKTGRVTPEEQARIFQVIAELEALPLYICDLPNMTTAQVRADLSRKVDELGVQWFVYDYLYLANDKHGMTETEATQLISKEFRGITRTFDVAGIVIHSMNKVGIGTTTPTMETLRGSGQISYDADLIAFMNPFIPMTEQDNMFTEDERKNLFTMTFDKGRELEDVHKYIHYKRPNSPMYIELYPVEEDGRRDINARIN